MRLFCPLRDERREGANASQIHACQNMSEHGILGRDNQFDAFLYHVQYLLLY